MGPSQHFCKLAAFPQKAFRLRNNMLQVSKCFITVGTKILGLTKAAINICKCSKFLHFFVVVK